MDKVEKLEEIEVKLISQEHRSWSILSNLYRYLFTNDSKRKKASILAFIFNLILSRSTVALGLVGFISYFLAWQNNNLLEKQNVLIQEQSQLSEANRLSSLVFLSSNILDKLDEELKNKENTNRILSDQLIGRIASLSKSLKPYKSYQDSILSPLKLSPERGQLLMSIAYSNIDANSLKKLFSISDFSYSDLENVVFENTNLIGIQMPYSNCHNVKFINCNLVAANLKHSNLERVEMDSCKLGITQFENCNFRHGTIMRSEIQMTNFYKCDFRNANIYGSKFDYNEPKDINVFTPKYFDYFSEVGIEMSEIKVDNKNWIKKLTQTQTVQLDYGDSSKDLILKNIGYKEIVDFYEVWETEHQDEKGKYYKIDYNRNG